MSVGAGLIGSQSVACIASETLPDGDKEEDVILSLTEMVSSCSLDVTETESWSSFQ